MSDTARLYQYKALFESRRLVTRQELQALGEVSLAKGQAVKLSLRPVADGWQPVNVRKVELKPQP